MNAENLVLVVQRQLKASPERLYDAWTRPELMMKWFHAGESMSTPNAETDLKINGEWKLTMHHSDTNQDKHMNGKYLVLDRPNKLVFTWYPCERDYETKVTLLFEKVSDGMTKMTLTQEGLRNEEDYKGHGEGWKACFDILEKFLKEGEGK